MENPPPNVEQAVTVPDCPVCIDVGCIEAYPVVLYGDTEVIGFSSYGNSYCFRHGMLGTVDEKFANGVIQH